MTILFILLLLVFSSIGLVLGLLSLLRDLVERNMADAPVIGDSVRTFREQIADCSDDGSHFA